MGDTNPTRYTIEPTLSGTGGAATYVLLLFGGYLAFLGYLATYDLSYYPNFNMFLNFFWDNYDTSTFAQYIRNVASDPSNASAPAPPTPKSESFVPSSSSSSSFIQEQHSTENLGSNLLQNLWMQIKHTISRWYQQRLVKWYVRGSTFKMRVDPRI